jgi:branched-subunit amino acid transport protein
MTTAWLLVFGLAAIAFMTRAVFILPDRHLRLSPTIERLLRFAPAAALMAIVIPDVARLNGDVSLSAHNPRLIAGLIAFVVAATTRNILLTIVLGMAALWLAKAIV